MNSNYKKVVIIAITIFVIGIGIFAYFNHQYPTRTTTISNTSEEITYFNKDENYNFDSLHEQTIELDGGYIINQEGVYHFTGTTNQGILVNTTGVVKIILDNVEINTSTGATIHIKQSKFCMIELIGENKLSDGNDEREEDAVIYSKDDLVFSGEGKVVIEANCNDGIVSKDDLKFNNGTYIITSLDDGIRGKDQVYITGGTFDIQCKGDAVKSDNEEKGDIYIKDGTFKLTTSNTEDKSAKGIKAYRSLVIEDGTFEMNTQDDSIHSDGIVTIQGGQYTINTQDDAIHANSTLLIEQGTIDVVSCYEGLEAEVITINGGDISIVASDDGINCASGNSNESTGFSFPQQKGDMKANNNLILTINGGNIYCNVSGDGLDSNGSIYINGGYVFIDGPDRGDNTALDSNGECMINGGEVIALCASGMFEMPDNQSSINMIVTSVNQAKHIVLEGDEELLNITTKKNYDVMIYASSKLVLNQEYKLTLDDETSSIQINDTITQNGNFNMSNSMGGFHGGNKPGMNQQRPEGNNWPENNQQKEPPADGNRPEGNPFGNKEGMQKPNGNFKPQM